MLGRCCCGPLLTAASCSAARKTRDQRHNQALRQPACPCEATATRGDSIYRRTREALEDRPTREQVGASRRPW